MLRNLLGAVTLCAAITACSQQYGREFDPETARTFTPGVTTERQAVAALGEPVSRATYRDGSELLQWIYTEGSLTGHSGAQLAVLFGPKGKMVRITRLTRE